MLHHRSIAKHLGETHESRREVRGEVPERGEFGEGNSDVHVDPLPPVRPVAARRDSHVEEDPPAPVRHGLRLERFGHRALPVGAHARVVKKVHPAAKVQRLGQLDELQRREHDGLLLVPVVLPRPHRRGHLEQHAAVPLLRPAAVRLDLERGLDHLELGRSLTLVHGVVAVHPRSLVVGTGLVATRVELAVIGGGLRRGRGRSPGRDELPLLEPPALAIRRIRRRRRRRRLVRPPCCSAPVLLLLLLLRLSAV
mmetsp:Transcript_10725/g.48344  ORF Transcript_10725/g.48344 Transcript_10725/m.48344 type:complete len:253 (+) Transcript_10725:3688-4446(+)